MRIRRVVTGRDGSGQSAVLSDGHSPRETEFRHTPGFVSSPLWVTQRTPEVPGGAAAEDPAAAGGSLLAPAGGATFIVITFPPDSVMAAPGFDPAAAVAEHLAAVPGISDAFEPDVPGMHTTPTLDFVTVIKGRIVLELDAGRTVTLHEGDTVVQQGVRHAWRNPGLEPATISVVMLGAKAS